jgi:prepilin signal peptidase PulO-like enzyme (type II secretory pathway)
MFFKIKTKHLKKISMGFLKEFFNPKQLLNSVLYLFAIFWIIQILMSLIGLSNNYLLMIGLTVVTMSIIQKKFKKKSLYVMILLSLLRLFIDKSIYSLSFLINMLILVFVWRLFRSFLCGSISKLGREIFTKNTNINKLKPGMILSEMIQRKEKITHHELKELKKQSNIKIIKHLGKYYIKKPKSHINFDSFLEEEAEGLTQKQIDKLKKIGIREIHVSQTIPFAPFMLLGVLLTIISNGNILILIKAFF